MQTANGRFDVNLTPDKSQEEAVDRMVMAKTYHGDLNGVSAGTMLAVRTDVEGSAGYVAIENFEGSLRGSEGGFSLQHNGILNRGTPSLAVQVIPDSGTGALKGISGAMTIDIQPDGTHDYSLEYHLP